MEAYARWLAAELGRNDLLWTLDSFLSWPREEIMCAPVTREVAKLAIDLVTRFGEAAADVARAAIHFACRQEQLARSVLAYGINRLAPVGQIMDVAMRL